MKKGNMMHSSGSIVILLMIASGVCVSFAQGQVTDLSDAIVIYESESPPQPSSENNWPPGPGVTILVGAMIAFGLIPVPFPRAYRSFIWWWYSRLGWRPVPGSRWQSLKFYRLSGICMITVVIAILLLVYVMQ